jgi:osmotically-inducible protein OsmY
VKSVENRLRVLFPTTYPTPGDARIEGNIRALLETNPAIDARNIRVSSLNNVVTLTGSVATDWQKGRAGYIAVNVEGVLELRNELRVVPRGARADVDIEKDIEDSLARNAFIRLGHVRVEVRSGAVVLSGTVDDYQEYRTAERIASHTNGVVGVTNSLAIR